MSKRNPSKEAMVDGLAALIEKHGVFIWTRSQDAAGTGHDTMSGRIQMIADAVSVAVNGQFIQIELDPKYKIVRA